ncbi:hypothetical protein ABEB36_015104 [Hypothenemus hampei]|uniref:Uncharacterized protein n=1 Tax=Hypothenemus hampei TaxID=57062 RepID=A0ABD1E1B8_HYPHA
MVTMANDCFAKKIAGRWSINNFIHQDAAFLEYLRNNPLQGMRQRRWDFLVCNLIVTDEKTFQSTYNGQFRIYRPRNMRFEGEYTNSLGSRSGRRFSVNIWGWISVYGTGVCWRIEGGFDTVNYNLNNIMLSATKQMYPGHNFIYQINNYLFRFR